MPSPRSHARTRRRPASPPFVPESQGLSVLARLSLAGQAEWLRVGRADLHHDPAGRPLLRICLGAIPDDRFLYIPLRELLELAHDLQSLAQPAAGHA